jgi:TIR domain
MAHDVFVSYASPDAAVANTLCKALEARDLRVWIAPRDVLPGATWMSSIPRAIDGCKVLVLIYSSHSGTSDYVELEINRAIENKKIIIPFCLKAMDKSQALGFVLSKYQWLDAFPGAIEPHVERLVATTRRYVVRPPAPPAGPGDKKTSAAASKPEKGVRTVSPPALVAPPETEREQSQNFLSLRLLAPAGLVVAALAGIAIFAGNRPPPTDPPDVPSQNRADQAMANSCRSSENNGAPGMDDINGYPEVLSLDCLSIRGKFIKLANVGTEKVHAAAQLSNWIALNGRTVHCTPVWYLATIYRCDVGQAHLDVAKHILDNQWAENVPIPGNYGSTY